MNRSGAILKFILIGLVVVFLIISAALSFMFQSEHTKCIKLQEKVTELAGIAKSTEDKLESTKKKVSELTMKLQEAKERLAAVTDELDKEKASRQESVKELEQIKSDIEQQKASRQDIEGKLNEAQEEGRKLKAQLKEVEQKKAELEAKIKSLETSSGVELGKVVVNNDNAAAPKAAEAVSVADQAAEAVSQAEQPSEGKGEAVALANPLEGKVTVVNKEYNFAVINLGQKDGVVSGTQFSVLRDGKEIGEVTVEKVHESMSAAGFATELKDVIQENDLVVQKAK
jgi:predicted RNase H-like nuclease (RuvC/YqgF family)